MIKKEFEKESYLAPEWGLRVVTVERHFLNDSPIDNWNEGGGGSYGDGDSNDNGDY